MVDLFSNSGNLAIPSELTNNVLVVLALAESHGLINWVTGVGNNVLQLQWTKFVPLVLRSFQSNAVRLLIGMSLSIVVIKS